MFFLNPVFNYTGGPGWNSGYVLMAGGVATTGVSNLVDRIALDGSGNKSTTVLTAGSKAAGGFGTSVVGFYVGGAYNSSSTTSTTMNAARNTILNVTFGNDTWSTATMFSGMPNTGGSFGNDTVGFYWGGLLNNNANPSAGIGFKYVYSASASATMSFKVAACINAACSNYTDALSLGGETGSWSTSFTPAFTTAMYGYNIAGDTSTTPTTILPSARGGMQCISNASHALFNNGANASSLFSNSFYYTWSAQTSVTLSVTMATMSLGGAACGTTRGIFAGGVGSSLSGSASAVGGTSTAIQHFLWASQTYVTGTSLGQALGTARNGIAGISSLPGYLGG